MLLKTLLTSVLLTGAAYASDSEPVRIVAPWEISSTDPATDGYIFLRLGVTETLVSTDMSGALVPGLATSWTVSEDGKSWRFSLREADFHNGQALTASVVVGALSRAAEHPGPVSKAPISSITADGKDVVVALDAPYAILPSILTHSSAMIVAPESFDDAGKSVSVIGTGPFKVETFAPPQSLSVSRFDGYWGEAAKITEATYTAAKRAETRALMAESGDADIVFTLDPPGFKRLGQIDTVDTLSAAVPRVMLLKLNVGHPTFSDVDARRALSMAIDREGIAAGIMRFPESAATQLYPPALPRWHDKSLIAHTYDPETAKSLLAGLGWVPDDDGVLVRDGERFSMLLRTFPDRPELPLVAAALQNQWAEIGVELEVSVSNYSEIPAGHQDGSLEIALYARNYGVTADPTATAKADFGTGGGDWGAMNWNESSVAEAIDIIASSADVNVRNRLIKTVVAEIHNQLPVIPIVWYQHTMSVAEGLDGVEIDPLERTYGLPSMSWAK